MPCQNKAATIRNVVAAFSVMFPICPVFLSSRHLLNDNTDHTAVGVIDNFLHGLLQFHLAFISDHGDFP